MLLVCFDPSFVTVLTVVFVIFDILSIPDQLQYKMSKGKGQVLRYCKQVIATEKNRIIVFELNWKYIICF